jgi:hypothetical protein
MWKNLIKILVVAVFVLYAYPVAAQSSVGDLPPVSAMEQAAPVSALSLPGSGWWTGFQVVNVGTLDTQVYATLYDASSSATYVSVTKTIAPNTNYTFSPLTDADWQPTIPSGFIGSGVVTSLSQPILAVVNEQNNLASGGIAAASYRGVTDKQTSDTLLFPLVKNDYGSTHKTTTFFIQNASGTLADITANYLIGSTTYTHVYSSVEAFKLQIVSPSDAGVPTGSLGSLTVTSSPVVPTDPIVPLAGIYNEHQTSATIATTLTATNGFKPSDADTILYVPLYKQNYNTTYSGVQIMNTSSVDSTTVTATLVPNGGGGPFITSVSIDPLQSKTLFNVAGWPNGYGAVTLESSGSVPIIAIVNETKYSTGSNGVYSAFAAKNLTHCAGAPLWKTRWNGSSSGQQSALLVQNVGDADATVHVIFTMTLGTTGTFTPPDRIVPAKSSTTYGPGAIDGGPTASGVGSVSISADQNIAVLVQETTLPGFTLRDMLNYEAFNQACP